MKNGDHGSQRRNKLYFVESIPVNIMKYKMKKIAIAIIAIGSASEASSISASPEICASGAMIFAIAFAPFIIPSEYFPFWKFGAMTLRIIIPHFASVKSPSTP